VCAHAGSVHSKLARSDAQCRKPHPTRRAGAYRGCASFRERDEEKMTLILALLAAVLVALRLESRPPEELENEWEMDADDYPMPPDLVAEHMFILQHGYGDEPDDPPLPRLRLPGGRGGTTLEELRALRRRWRATRVLASRATWLRARQRQARRSHQRAPRRRVGRSAAARSCSRARSADSVPPRRRGPGDLLQAGGRA
jgi:hypothetical protein